MGHTREKSIILSVNVTKLLITPSCSGQVCWRVQAYGFSGPSAVSV